MKLRLVASAGAIALLAAACGSSSKSASTSSGASGSGTTAVANGAPVKIAALLPLTGPIANKGMSDNLTLAANEINAKGGVAGHKVEVTFYDTMDLTPQSGRVAMQKALADNPTAVIGANISGQVAAGTDLINQAGIPLLNVGADPSTDPGKQNGSDWYFRVAIRGDRQAEAMSQYVANTLHAKNVLIGHSTDLTSTDGANYMQKDVTGMGVKATQTSWAPTATDLTNNALAAKGMDALMLVGYPAPESQMIKTMRANGINIPIIADYGASSIVQGKLNTTAELAGTAFVGNCEPIATVDANPAAKHYIDAMHSNFAGSYIYGFGYESVNLIAEAVKNSNGSLAPKDIKAGLAAIKNYQGVCGVMTADSAQNFLHSMPVISMENQTETFKTLVDNLTGDYAS
jgi:branched-chain amino acid transport system substrate-binding protein